MKRELLTKVITILLWTWVIFPVFAQTDTLFYINSSFETADDQAKWTSTPPDLNISWDYYEGGHNWPISAKSGDLNARFYRSDFGYSYYRNLVSEPIDLSTAEIPILTFYYAQDKNFNQDELRVLFKPGSGAQWDTVAYFPDEMENWQKESINLADSGAKYLCDNFQIGFLGYANGGNGVCVDSVTLEETASIDKFVKSFRYDAVQHILVASGTKQLPLIRLKIEISGNNGPSNLNSVSFRLNSGSASYFESGGFKLFKTRSLIFKSIENGNPTQIGSAVSISGNVVTFSGLNENLQIGENYIWLTADLTPSIEHDSSFSFGADANSFTVNDTTLPAAANSNIFSALIKEAVFYDNFDALTGWTLEEDFEIGPPLGKEYFSSKDPDYAYSGTNVLGTDLSDNGAYLYGFSTPYHATSPPIDLKYYDNVIVYLRKWNDFNPLDEASISFSTDNGSTWTPVWNSRIDNPSASAQWEEVIFTEIADELLSRKKNVRIRFSMDESNTSLVRAGFNIDNFSICANYLDNDVGITEIISPFDDCLGFNNDTVRIVVKNFAAEPTATNIPVYFGLWGPDSTRVTEYISGPIGVNDSVIYTFSNLANFPKGDIYDKFIVGVNMAGDEDASNDTLTKSLIIPDSYSAPITVDFEYKGGIWIPSEGSTWECRVPDGSIPVLPESPTSWILSPYGDYLSDDESWVVSNCFDLSTANRHILELDYWLTSEAGVDGAAVEYSTDDGNTWHLINYSEFGPAWGWYTSSVTALGSIGWSGITPGWVTAKEILPASLNTEVKVKFRIRWASDAVNTGRGLAFDNFKLYETPPDVGVSTIDVPYDACQYENPDELSIWVKNMGFNDLHTNDTLIVGYNFESEPTVIDTFTLASDLVPGDSVNFVFPVSFAIEEAGLYQINAYTLIEDDPWFYGTNNDTLNYTFNVWQNPITGLFDTIQSRQPDTLMLQANEEPEYSYYWEFSGINSADSYFDVSAPGVYYLTITESIHGCETYDSTYVELLFNDITVDSIIWPQSSCELSSAEPIQIQIRNSGTDSLIVSDQIYVYYEFDGGPQVSDVITLNEALLSGSTYWHTFEGYTENLSAEGDYMMKAYAYFGGDTIPENDTIVETITVFGYPDLFLGNDTVINGTEYLLEVDPTFISYTWSDGDTLGTRIIDTSGYYTLNVLDVNGCPASDDIDIWFRIRDVSPVRLLSPRTSCERNGNDYVQMQFINSGSDTIITSDVVTVSYVMDGGTRHTANVTNNQIYPGGTFNYNFGTQEDLSALGSYQFEITATTLNDLRPENDTLQPVVSTDLAPVVDLGVDDDEIYKMTEMVLDAGYGENYVYLWQDGSRGQTYTVTDITQVQVLVTDSTTGCYGGDTAFVYLDILDYMVTSVALDATACSGTYNNVDVDILNNGNLPRQGAEITLDFYLNSTYLFTEYFENIGSWPPGATRTLSTSTAIDLEETGNASFGIQLESTGDLRSDNDDFQKNLNVIQSPVVNFGNSQQGVEFPYTLDAGYNPDYTYLWNDGSDQSTYTATQPGTYTLTATGTNGCQTVRSVYLSYDLLSDHKGQDMITLDLYPNPANNFVNIDISFTEPDTYILEVINSQDILLLNRKIEGLEFKEELFIGNYPPGIYFIRIRNDTLNHVSKMIIH
ncbi:MAG: T9SS type A sorting domain-containing protein [Bacteroidales bacterium]|nr:T9SS type A sorting domain-containing protein [Bacteroidales bacterium]